MTGISVGNLYRFQYVQGTYDAPRLARVLSVRDTWEQPLKSIKTGDRKLRSRYLLTVREWNGQIRSMYNHAIVNVEKIGWFRSLLLRVGLKV